MTPRFAAALLAALVAAAGLALLARSVLAVERSLRAEDARLLAGGVEAPPPRGPVSRLAEALLGVGDDRAWREAVRLVSSGRTPGVPVRGILERHGEAAVRLDALARSGDPTRRSRALTLVGLLALEDAALDPGSGGRFLELGLDAFRSAVLLDPANEDAKYDLELVLARLAATAEARQAGEEQPAPQGRSAGSSTPGSGY